MNETLECFEHEAAKLMQSFPYENRCVLQKIRIKIMTRANYTYLFFLIHTLSCPVFPTN